jgi:hypothetical protein
MSIKTVLFLVCMLSSALLTQQTEKPNPSSCFRVLVKPNGWTIPQHSAKPLRTGPFKDVELSNLSFSTYSVRRTFFLPHYYVEDGALNLVSLRFRTGELKRLEVAGKPFAFLAAVRGVDVGTVGSVWWVDRDGNGSFSEFSWNPDFSKVPEWVKQRANAGPK